jgi:outer membrane protein OmpA-like peptidoglycan-associated protein
MTLVRRLSVLVFAAGLLLSIAHPPDAAAQNIEGEIQTLASRVDTARSANLHLIAPSRFEDAAEHLSEARRMLNEGERISDIREELQKGQVLINKAQRVIREFPDANVVISGHTDARGNDATNQKLSEERAQAVREYLLANMNVEPTRMRAVGYGESQPIATNETEAGRQKNRRIDVKISLPSP